MNRTGIYEAKVFQELVEAAKSPYDLSLAGALENDERLKKYICQTDMLNLFYGTERVDEHVVDLLQRLADECNLVGQFKEMRRGAVMNNIQGHDSEERQVLHTACRDLYSKTPVQPQATAQAKREMAKLEQFLVEIENGTICNSAGEKFDTMIQVGIGGSDLGPRAIQESLKPFGLEGRAVKFVSNVDPDDVASVLGQVNLSKTLINIVSKSGSTLETLTNETLVREALEKAGLEPAAHCIAVTGEGSPMDNPDNYLRSFYMYDYIGGRYSVTSMVGAVMLGFYLGFERLQEFLRGAAEMDEIAEKPDINKNVPLLLALLGVWNHNFLGHATVAVLPYSQALTRFPAHLQQCDMESNGKSVRRNGKTLETKSGPIIWGEPGTNGQHAFYQLLHQGTEIVPIEFIGFLENQYGSDLQVKGTTSQEKLLANLLAQSVAFATGKKDVNPNKNFSGNRPNLILLGKQLTPRVMGALLAAYEAKIVFQGFAWDVNSFDQEGVQLGKVLANRFLDLMGGVVGNDGVEKQLLEIVQEAEFTS